MYLRELQRGFSAAVFSGRYAEFGPHVQSTAVSESRRLQVYRNNLIIGLTGVLASVYPVVQRLVGEGFFRHACARYIPDHPSHSGDLHEYGADFPAFLADFEPAADLPYLPDVAALEWAWHMAYHAADRPPLDLAALARVSPNRYAELRFQLHPACRLVASRYPILRIWQVNRGASQETVDLAQGGVRLLVVRSGLEVEMQPLEPGDYALLDAFAREESLVRARAAAMAAEHDFDLNAALCRHVSRGTLTGFSL